MFQRPAHVSCAGLRLPTLRYFWPCSALTWSSGRQCRDLARIWGELQPPDASPQAWSACSSTTEWLGREPKELDLRQGRREPTPACQGRC